MAAGYDGSIRIDTNINAKGFNSGTKQINQGLGGITSSLKGVAAAAGIAFGVAAIINFGKSSVKAATELKNAMTGLQSIMDGQGRSFSKAQEFINSYVSDGLIPATQAITAYKNLAMRGYDTSQIEQVMVALKNSAAFGRQASLSMGDAVRSATEGLKNENSILVDNAGVTKNVSMMWKDYAKSIGVGVDSLTKQQKIQAEVLGIMEETRFQTGDAAKVADSYSGQILKLGFNFNNLKIAVGNALIPIAQAVLPSINAIIAALTKLANVFAQVSAAIFGKQAKQQEQIAKSGTSAAKAQENLGKATKKAGKEAKGALAGFDELNVLAKDTADAASATAGGVEDTAIGDITSNNELGADVTVSPAIQSAIDSIKSMLQELKKYIDTYIAPPFEEAVNKIKVKVDEFKDILGGIWSDITTLGAPLKDWFINDFTPFLQNIIIALGEIISGLFDSFNMVFSDIWEIVVYPALEKFITVGLPLLTDFSGELVDTFKVLFIEVKKIFDMLWKEGVRPALELITKIWLDLCDTIANAWNKYGAPIFEQIKIAFKAIGDLLKSVWETTLKPVWDNFMETVDWLWTEHLKPLLDNFLDLIGEFILGALRIINEFIAPLVKEFVEDFGPPIALVFNTILNVISTVIAAAIDIINGLITTLKGIIQFITGIFTGDWKKAWEGVVNVFKGIFEGIKGIVKGVVNIVIDLINGMIIAVTSGLNFIIKGLNKLSFSVPDWVPGIGGKSWGIDIQPLKEYKIPKLATGAVIPPNSEFLAILGDQKSGRNIEAPEGLIRKIIQEELGGLNVGGQEVTINFGGNMGQLIRLLKPYIDTENKRVGTSLLEGV